MPAAKWSKARKQAPCAASCVWRFRHTAKCAAYPIFDFLDGHPWLTPYAWCYRLIYNTLHCKDFMVRTARGLDSDDAYAAAKEELEFFKEMGLL